MPDTQPAPLAQALGRIPTGLYVVSTVRNGTPLGFVGSFLVQTGFSPPTVCVAVGHGREALEAIRASGAFAVTILDDASRGHMRAFFKASPEGGTPFDGLEVVVTPSGAPALADGLAWLDCRVVGEHETGDHVVVFGEVRAGERRRDGDPAIHVRKDGLGY